MSFDLDRSAPPRMNKGLALAAVLLFIVCLCWPMYVSGQLLAFYDTRSYLRGGEKILDVLLQMLSTPETQPAISAASGGDGAAPAALTLNEEGRNVTGRSFTYSAFAFAAFSIGGALGIALAQAAITTIMALYLIGDDARQSPIVLVTGAALIAALTGLPWYASFLMPDILGALIVIFGVLLVRDIDRFGFWNSVFLLALASFAATAHYGNMPLIFGVVVSALCVRLLRRRLNWKVAAIGLVAVLAAPVANLGASAVVLDEASLAPKRIPVLLARSLNDGPALWYLQEVCPEADLGLCEAYGDDFSPHASVFLWSDEGVMALPPALLDRIRAEEFEVVFSALLRYPVQQLQSFFGHAFLQLFRIGVGEIAVADGMDGFEPVITHAGPAKELQDRFDAIIPIATLLSVLGFAAFAFKYGLSARWVDMIAVFAIGYVLNALIYGGLSAPIDRYQGRVAWIIPVLLVIFVAESVARRRRERHRRQMPAPSARLSVSRK